VQGFNILAVNVPDADLDTLRSLGDKFREKYPRNGAAILASGPSIISVITQDLVERGVKAGDLIAAVGGRGGGRPNTAQGSLAEALNVEAAMGSMGKAVASTLK
jgi:alanyl-tRNA synthetase